MRIVSWTIVAGSILVLVYTGVSPTLKELNLPEMNSSQVSGTMSARGAGGVSAEAHPGLAETQVEDADSHCAESENSVDPGVQSPTPQQACAPKKLVLK